MLESCPEPGDELIWSADVIVVPVQDGSARLLDMGGDFHALSPTGACMMEALIARGAEAAVREVATRFDVDPATVRADLQELIGNLLRRGLIQRRDSRQSRSALRRWIVNALLCITIPLMRAFDLSLRARAWITLAMARLSFAWCGWTTSLDAWDRFFPASETSGERRQRVAAMILDHAVREAAAKHLFHVDCKERSLTCWALGRTQGLAVELVVGVELFPFAGHCWCEAGSVSLTDDVVRVRQHRAVVRYG